MCKFVHIASFCVYDALSINHQICRSRFKMSNLSMQTRLFLQVGLSLLLQVHIILGTVYDWSATTIIVGSMLMGGFILWMYLYGVADAKVFVESLVGSAHRMSAGDLSRPVPVGGSIMARQGLKTMSGLQDSLRDLIGTLDDGARQVTSASSEIASGNMDLSTRTERGSSDLQASAGALRDMTEAAQQSSVAMREASTLSQGASLLVQQSGQVVSKAVTAMSGVSQSSRKIADIISVIDGIAFQTNILALNAAVEAARAGEQGRGFAVVASEVRSLAGRSAGAAKEIKDLISHSVQEVDTGSGLINDAGTRMQEVVASVERVAGLIGQATQMAQTQSEGLRDVSASIDRLDQSMQQNAALVEEGAAAAGTLHEQAARLTALVQRFRLG
jgi:methyl-accepting chemotaxis protein